MSTTPPLSPRAQFRQSLIEVRNRLNIPELFERFLAPSSSHETRPPRRQLITRQSKRRKSSPPTILTNPIRADILQLSKTIRDASALQIARKTSETNTNVFLNPRISKRRKQMQKIFSRITINDLTTGLKNDCLRIHPQFLITNLSEWEQYRTVFMISPMIKFDKVVEKLARLRSGIKHLQNTLSAEYTSMADVVLNESRQGFFPPPGRSVAQSIGNYEEHIGNPRTIHQQLRSKSGTIRVGNIEREIRE